MNKKDLALDNLQWLICQKNQFKPMQKLTKSYRNQYTRVTKWVALPKHPQISEL